TNKCNTSSNNILQQRTVEVNLCQHLEKLPIAKPECGEGSSYQIPKVTWKGKPGKIYSWKKSEKGATKKYIPPHLVPVHYDETEAEHEQKRLDRAKKRALSSSVIRELKEQYSDAPEEICDAWHPHVTRQSQEDQHRINYEESMMSDSTHGKFHGTIKAENGKLVINGKAIAIFQESDPANIK
ncbi:hypothetical protein STEG23_004199, partial [Scotinomys teguina]